MNENYWREKENVVIELGREGVEIPIVADVA